MSGNIFLYLSEGSLDSIYRISHLCVVLWLTLFSVVIIRKKNLIVHLTAREPWNWEDRRFSMTKSTNLQTKIEVINLVSPSFS